jgi:hypothetical protein
LKPALAYFASIGPAPPELQFCRPLHHEIDETHEEKEVDQLPSFVTPNKLVTAIRRLASTIATGASRVV